MSSTAPDLSVTFDLCPQLLEGASGEQRENLGVTTPDYYFYLNQSGTYTVEDVNDKREFTDTMVCICLSVCVSFSVSLADGLSVCLSVCVCVPQEAMSVVGLSVDDQDSVLQLVAGILHLGNISFREENNYAVVESQDCKTLHSTHCTVHTAQYTLHSAHCTVHTAQYTLHSTHCTVVLTVHAAP